MQDIGSGVSKGNGRAVLNTSPEELLRKVFGYPSFRPGQREIVGRILAGGNALLIMPTGSGKSICFQMPALLRDGTGIVVSPLISLMQDQVEGLKQLGVRAEVLNSSLSRSAQRRVEQDLMAGEIDLLYVAPERLMTDDFIGLLGQVEVALFAIDEAHCISQWGHDFRPEYLHVGRLRTLFPGVPFVAATATADGPTQRDILRRLHLKAEDLYVTGFDRPNIRYSVVLKNNVRQQLLRFIRDEHSGDAGIVYCLSRKRVEEITAWLVEHGVRAVPYHAGLPAGVRQINQERFIAEEGLTVVATVAFGMGIDKPNVRYVAHVDVPRSPEAYYQETGRAGRDGLPADAWLTYGLSDVVVMRRMIETSGADGAHKWVERHKLNAIAGYCETAACRREVILKYFGESAEGNCGNCDNCLQPVETLDGTTAAQKVLSCIIRTGRRFGSSHIIDVLTGQRTDKVVRFGHDALPTFGVGTELSVAEWRSVIRQLVASDILRADVERYGILSVTRAGEPILRGTQTLLLRKDPAPVRNKKRSGPPPSVGRHPELFEALRQTRLALAREQGVPPYTIFHDRTLLEMAAHQPADINQFGMLHGVGSAKKERYGEAFLAVIRRFS